MRVGKPIAIGLAGLSLLGAEERITAWSLDGAGLDSSSITADAGPLGGTILHEKDSEDRLRALLNARAAQSGV